MFGKAALVFTTVLYLGALGLPPNNSTHVSPCQYGGRTLDIPKSVNITDCGTQPCKLKKKTTVKIDMKFVPDENVESLTNAVYATLIGIQVPFLGVHGTDACKNIYDVEGRNVGCPLKAGTEYYYKNGFPVKQGYPSVSTTVHWALMKKNNPNPITCFEVRSTIVN